MKQFFFIIVLLIPTFFLGQNFDSLLTVANNLPHDSDKVNLLYKQGFEKRVSDAQYSYLCAKQAEAIAQKLSLPFYSAKVNNLLGILFYRKGDYSRASSYHQIALNLRTVIGDKRGIGLSQANLGNVYSELHRYKLAEECYLKALQINNELGDLKQKNNTLLNLGAMCMQQKKYDAAVMYFNNVLELALKNNDYELQAIAYNNLAVVNMTYLKYEESIANAENSIKAKVLSENEIEIADSYINIALANLKLGKKDESWKFITKADSIIKIHDYVAARLNAYNFKKDYFYETKNYEQAFLNLKAYNTLNDSITMSAENVKYENDFVENFEVKKPVENVPKGNSGIYLFFTLFLGLIIGACLFALKNKRE